MGTGKKDRMEEAMQEALASVERIEQEGTAELDADGEEEEEVEEEEAAVEESDEEPEVIVEEPVEGEEGEEAAEPVETVSLEDQNKKLNDQLLRLAADFENFRKRSRREQEELRKYGVEQVVRAMLPVLDNLERALVHADDSDPIIQGVGMVAKQFVDALATYGIRGFSSVGEAFDPERHEAMGQAPTDEVPAGAVFQELEKGYTLHDRLLRPAKVMVAVPPPEPVGDGEQTEEGEAS